MTPFQQLAAHFRTQEITVDFIQDFIARMGESSPQVGTAMTRHLADIQRETPSMPLPLTLATIYQRTFFDPETSERYGTGHIARNPVQQAHLVRYVISGGATGPASTSPTVH